MSLTPQQQLFLFNAQTSGGDLLRAAPEDVAPALVAKLEEVWGFGISYYRSRGKSGRCCDKNTTLVHVLESRADKVVTF